ncbi:MAG: hypothetical protein ACO1QB_02215 [Verrucomicrobiales bacterium]
MNILHVADEVKCCNENEYDLDRFKSRHETEHEGGRVEKRQHAHKTVNHPKPETRRKAFEVLPVSKHGSKDQDSREEISKEEVEPARMPAVKVRVDRESPFAGLQKAAEAGKAKTKEKDFLPFLIPSNGKADERRSDKEQKDNQRRFDVI